MAGSTMARRRRAMTARIISQPSHMRTAAHTGRFDRTADGEVWEQTLAAAAPRAPDAAGR
jgi:hypothetical protein